MTNIIISDLNPANSDSYMRELSDEELNALAGGGWLEDLVYTVTAGVVGGFIGFWIALF